MKSNDELVRYLVDIGYLRTDKVIEAFRSIDRRDFVPEDKKDLAYEDVVIPVKEGVTLSQPSVVAIMIEELSPEEGNKILEIGTGTGYTTAILSKLVGDSGKVISIEIDPEAHEIARRNLEKYGLNNIELVLGDGSLGYPKESPFDRIIVHSAVHRIPNTFLWQLRDGGVIIAPVGPSWNQKLMKVIKKNGTIQKKELIDVLFVPLRGKFGDIE